VGVGMIRAMAMHMPQPLKPGTLGSLPDVLSLRLSELMAASIRAPDGHVLPPFLYERLWLPSHHHRLLAALDDGGVHRLVGD